MRDIRIISGKQIVPELDTVLEWMECTKTDAVCQEAAELYRKFLPEVKMRIRPRAALSFGTVEMTKDSGVLKQGASVLYVIATIGDGVSRLRDSFFSKGEHLKAMLLDAMADSCLFAFEEAILPRIKQMCQEEGFGVSRRLEAPSDMPIEMQKQIFEAVNAARSLSLSITSGYMYDPVKSAGMIFELTSDCSRFEAEHDCSRCAKTECPHRKDDSVLLRVKSQDKTQTFRCPKGKNLMQILMENDFFVNAVCGGNGKCGKCGVQVVEGTLAVTGADKKCFLKKELERGMRLSCTAVLKDNLTIRLLGNRESEFAVLGSLQKKKQIPDRDREYGIAIDIGTTTLALSLVGLGSGLVIDTYTAINRQRIFGADVITRIQASNAGKREQLRQSICKDLQEGIQILLQKNDTEERTLKKIVIAGNTTMVHLLRGYSCETLGAYPFTPVSLKQETFSFGNVKVTILPGISAFVGADIVAGLYECGFQKKESLSLFVDLGTNGEMAVGTKEKIFVTSTAAGPAFEGGNIKWGTGSIPGAICGVSIREGNTHIRTIGDAAPKGICGTGVVETTAELLKSKLIDETGKLTAAYFEQGFPLAENDNGEQIVFTQKDIRELQMAKAAIRAGIEMLLLRCKASYEEIEHLYLAGGFGFFLDQEKAAAIGILPEELADKTVAAGNTSLNGAIRFLLASEEECVQKLTEIAEEVKLALDEEFQELYMKSMSFPPHIDVPKV